MNEELEQQVFEIISQSGDAKSDVMFSLKKIKDGDYDSARKLLKEASNKISNAANIHVDILSSSMKEKDASTHFLVVHAEDHYSNASFAHSLVNELVDIFESMDTRK